MATIDDQVRHILFHVNAEDATRDGSQVAGVADRAQRVRDLVASSLDNGRIQSRKNLLLDLRKTADLIMRAALNEIDEDDDGQSLHSALQIWAGKNTVNG